MLCVAGAVGVLVVYIGYPYGGWDWGGRFLVPAIPLLCAALGSLRGRIAVVAITLAAVAAVMQIPTIIAPYERAYAEARQDGIYLEDERWTPSESPLVLMWPAMVHQIRAARGSSVNEPPGTTAKRAGGLDNQIFKVVGLWWWRPRSGGFRLFGLIVSFAAVVIAGRLLRRGTFASSRGN
jgi:hypothetical protein